ncbi:MAG TPA: hypothetical protein VJC18_10665, partial [bacterium]|nr:hypothetical protein [bacterium]
DQGLPWQPLVPPEVKLLERTVFREARDLSEQLLSVFGRVDALDPTTIMATNADDPIVGRHDMNIHFQALGLKVSAHVLCGAGVSSNVTLRYSANLPSTPSAETAPQQNYRIMFSFSDAAHMARTPAFVQELCLTSHD